MICLCESEHSSTRSSTLLWTRLQIFYRVGVFSLKMAGSLAEEMASSARLVRLL